MLFNNTSTYKNLSFIAEMQENGYYCGPASAYMVLKSQGIYCTQTILALSLGTDSTGTNFGSNWVTTMNEFTSRSAYNIMWGDGIDSTAKAIQMTDAAIGSNALGYGVIYNTIQKSGTSSDRLSGYPSYLSSSVYHYVAGEGYNTSDPSNRTCYYVDPTNVRPTAYGHKSVGFRLMCKLTTERGLIY